MSTGTFGTLLVANRGEIAVRVLRTARGMGLRTVAVHSDADAGAPHVRAADVAVRIGPARAADSYLDVDAVLDAARRTGAGAIHPGYGFLAEDAGFARACDEAGVVFVGPPADAIAAMGDKAAAKQLLADHEVPLVDGYEGEDQSDDRLAAEADRIGFPLMVKAAAGGGGTGMRLVTDPDGLAQALAGARREAAGAFGHDHLILERALVDARHVEVQVLADAHGRTLALGERDCSVQRRHQKVVEEAPCPVIDEATRTAMGDAAVAAARAVGYVGAGTVEFLLAADGSFAFLEMNTRLQVEHPVTELVTGLDLVEWQLRVAAGEPLALDVPPPAGHAIEVRLYAEDPARDFLPQTGPVRAWDPPEGPGIRVDAGVVTGGTVTADYDPMLAKVIAHGDDRDEARRRLVRALERTRLVGPTTNRSHLLAILDHPTFAAGEATTSFLDDHRVSAPTATAGDVATVAAVRHLRAEAAAERAAPGLGGFTTRGHSRAHQRLAVGGRSWRVTLLRDEAALHVEVTPAGDNDGDSGDDGDAPDGTSVVVTPTLQDHGEGLVEVVVDGVSRRLSVLEVTPHRSLVTLPRLDLVVVDELLLPPDAAAAAGAGVLLAPMHGAVSAVHVAVGDVVAAGDALLSVEAMKMEHVVVADLDGTVVELVDEGTQVAADAVVARIELADDDADA